MKVQRLVKVIFNYYISNIKEEEMTTSAGQLVKCMICDRMFRLITNTHLKKHNLTVNQYKEKFPGHILSNFEWLSEWRNSEENKQQLSKQAKLVVSSVELTEKRNTNHKIAVSKDSYTENLSIAMKNYGVKARALGTYHLLNKPVTDRMRMSNFDRWVEKYGLDDAYKRQQAWQEKNILPHGSQYTKIELFVAKILKNAGYVVDPQYDVLHYRCDIFLPELNLIVEVNGDYWHANPNRFKPEDLVGQKQLKAQDIWNYDAKKLNCLRSLGFKTYVVWETDIKTTTPDKLVEDIVRSIEKSVE
jgi:G:T-mismatch repair DNA endonuclease (very short patch repair protein)